MKRLLVPEEMDDPSLDGQTHFQALQGLARINTWSGSAGIVGSAIQALAQMTGQRSLRVLDIATGAGDIPVAVWKKARKKGFFLEMDGCDKSPQAIICARKRAQQSGAQVRFYSLDIAHEEIPAGYDILVSSLFFHHLENKEAAGLLRRMAQAAKQMVLVNDLVRCASGLALAQVGTRLLSRSRVVHADGLRSVRAAFTVEEIRKMAQEAGLKGARVERRWPWRFLLTWKK